MPELHQRFRLDLSDPLAGDAEDRGDGIEGENEVGQFHGDEHEDERILLSKETWTLLENGAVLRRVRQRSGGGQQTLIYIR